MIRTVRDLYLGRDTTRIKDKRDAQRQHATVDAILGRFFAPAARDRREVQMLADEVGMGKTFVALAVAHAILSAQRRGEAGDLEGCYQKVLVVTPQNSALFRKWRREVEEFVRRCFPVEAQGAMQSWFAPAVSERIDDVVWNLRRGGGGPSVVVTHTGIFNRGKLTDYDLKRRLVLSQLFRLWGTRFRYEDRERLLRGAPAGWPQDLVRADLFTAEQIEHLPVSAEEVYAAIARIAATEARTTDGPIERLLARCKEISAPYVRDRGDLFKKIEDDLVAVYRLICEDMIRSDLPLVIIDEAHNWKNGPSANANGYHAFRRLIAPRARRVLLLTATPFQLRPEEMLQVLDVVGHIKPSPTLEISVQRTNVLTDLRDRVIAPVLQQSSACSRRFQRAWARLPRTVTPDELRNIWSDAPLQRGRATLAALVRREGSLDTKRVDQRVEQAVEAVDPDCRQLMREALRLYAYNQDLSHQLGQFVIRHRRGTDHRLFRVGSEYGADASAVAARPDAHLLHFAPGIDVRGNGELPQYLLMRCVSEMKEGRGRSSLGSALTGCYSTLLESTEGRQVSSRLRASDAGRMYLDLLLGMVDKTKDPKHPKLQQVVDSAVEAWRAGEKTLIFCFRVNTARRLREIIEQRIRAELRTRRKRLLGGENALKALKSRLTARDRDLVGLGLDRPLLSFLWASPVLGVGVPYGPSDLLLRDEELEGLAKLALERGVDLAGDRVDRVFLFRATEHLVAKRILATERHTGWRRLLQEMAASDWVNHPYGGQDVESSFDGTAHDEAPATDERGLNRVYQITRAAGPEAVTALARELRNRRDRARQQGVAILDSYASSHSLWFGPDALVLPPSGSGNSPAAGSGSVTRAIAELSRQLTALTQGAGSFDWSTRRVVIEAMRRTVLRESVLLRLLPSKHDREEAGWGELLAERFLAPMPGQHESMADRIAAFLEDLAGMSGSVFAPGTSRHTLIDATRLRDQQFVALVTGEGGKAQNRERVFTGFNTPLLPEVLICTSVGQEGIDLHRHCRIVVHYDLAWNPAVLEQRTGRVDRIGSKTFRERGLAPEGAKPYLEVGVPFLAGTYDERMYEELRLRAQTFEVLTGGDFAVDNAEGNDDRSLAERHEAELSVVPLPEEMVNELRVKLHVWAPER